MFLAKDFKFRPFEKTLPEVNDSAGEVKVTDVVVVFVHSEPQDETDPSRLETKFVKNIKWIAGKRGTSPNNGWTNPCVARQQRRRPTLSMATIRSTS